MVAGRRRGEAPPTGEAGLTLGDDMIGWIDWLGYLLSLKIGSSVFAKLFYHQVDLLRVVTKDLLEDIRKSFFRLCFYSIT